MKKHMIAVLVILVLVILNVHVQAAINWDFYEDGTIDPCDEYNNVGVFDTPPGHTTVDMLGGIVDSMAAFDESTVNVTGGTVSTLRSANLSTVNVSGGSVYGLESWDTGMVNIWGSADVFSLLAREYGVLNMSGGTVDHIDAFEFGTVNLSGGLVLDGLWAGDSGIINIYGYDLEKFASGGKYGDGFVSGVWQDDVAFNFDFYGSGTYSRTNLYEIPEPTTLALIMAGVLFLRKRGK